MSKRLVEAKIRSPGLILALAQPGTDQLHHRLLDLGVSLRQVAGVRSGNTLRNTARRSRYILLMNSSKSQERNSDVIGVPELHSSSRRIGGSEAFWAGCRSWPEHAYLTPSDHIRSECGSHSAGKGPRPTGPWLRFQLGLHV